MTIQGSPAHSEKLCGSGSVTPRLFQSGQKPPFLIPGQSITDWGGSGPLRDLGRKILYLNDRALAANHSELYYVLQFTHISRPMIIHQRPHGLVTDFMNLFCDGCAGLAQKQARKERNIFPAIVERGKLDSRHTYPVEQISAEISFGYQLLQIMLGGREYPDIDFALLGVAETRYLSFLKNSQQAILDVYRNVSNFIEKEGSSVGRLKKTEMVINRPCESSPPVAEQLTFQQRIAQPGAVHADKWPVFPVPGKVDGPRHHFLPRSGIPFDQDSGIDM